MKTLYLVLLLLVVVLVNYVYSVVQQSEGCAIFEDELFRTTRYLHLDLYEEPSERVWHSVPNGGLRFSLSQVNLQNVQRLAQGTFVGSDYGNIRFLDTPPTTIGFDYISTCGIQGTYFDLDNIPGNFRVLNLAGVWRDGPGCTGGSWTITTLRDVDFKNYFMTTSGGRSAVLTFPTIGPTEMFGIANFQTAFETFESTLTVRVRTRTRIEFSNGYVLTKCG